MSVIPSSYQAQVSESMAASKGSKPVILILLFLNFMLYFIVTIIASWAVDHGIKKSQETASTLSIPARLFPIYFPMGNLATGFFILFSLIAGVVGMTTSLTGLTNALKWDVPSLQTAASSSLATWSITLLAMGLACKEINIGWTDENLRTLETITIVVSATQMFCTGAIHVGVEDAIADARGFRTIV